MATLDIPCNFVNADAADYEDIDKYTCFHMYNPFRGEIFQQVIRRIEDSYSRNKRDIYLVYGNPFEHQVVIKNQRFVLIDQVRTDFWDPLVNIYCIRG
jgi:hypothetical protein